MTKHTSGPWEFNAGKVFADDYGMNVCDIRGWGHLTGKGHSALGLSPEDAAEIQNANGHLIAAAPGMYEALIDLLDICECDNTDAECINRFGFAMEAIKKAEGK